VILLKPLNIGDREMEEKKVIEKFVEIAKNHGLDFNSKHDIDNGNICAYNECCSIHFKEGLGKLKIPYTSKLTNNFIAFRYKRDKKITVTLLKKIAQEAEQFID
jgi:hypothetical protein